MPKFLSVVDTFHAQTGVAIDGSLARCTLFGSDVGGPVAAVTLECSQMFQYESAASHPARGASLSRVRARIIAPYKPFRGTESLPRSRISLTHPVAYPMITRFLSAFPVGEYCICWARTCTLYHAKGDLRNACQPMMKPIPEGKSVMVNKSGKVGASTLPSHTAVAYALLEASAAVVAVRLQHPLPCNQKRQGHLRVYPVIGVILSSKALSSTVTNRMGYVFSTEWTILHDAFLEFAV